MNENRWSISLRKPADVAIARKVAMQALDGLGASQLVRTRFVTAVSEIARNAVIHAGGGLMELRIGRLEGAPSIIARCEDRGSGIADVAMAMKDGYSTGSGMGLGLGGAKRLVNRFALEAASGGGTVVTLEMRVR